MGERAAPGDVVSYTSEHSIIFIVVIIRKDTSSPGPFGLWLTLHEEPC